VVSDPMSTVTKQVGGAKNGGKRVVETVKAPKFYPADDINPLVSTGKAGKHVPAREAAASACAKLRGSITPGTVLILLAGRFRGRRCVFLKQLSKSGLLLVSGPYGVNGIPLRRVNQAYCIATSTKVDIAGVDCKKFTDEYFGKATKAKRVKKDGKDFMEEDTPAATGPTADRKADQAAVDAALTKAIGKVPLMAKYLKSRFTLSKHQAPHTMKF